MVKQTSSFTKFQAWDLEQITVMAVNPQLMVIRK